MAVLSTQVPTTSTVRITNVPPGGWDDALLFPTLGSAFARAARVLGQRALYATDGVSRALILTRALPAPFVRWWTTRAKIYVETDSTTFVPAVVDAVRAQGVSYVRLGDAVWGLPAVARTVPGMRSITTHLVTFDGTTPDDAALARMESKTRAHLRKAQREGVVVTEVRDAGGIDEFCRLFDETSERMRARAISAAAPTEYFRAVFREMVPRGEAIFLIARLEAQALAGGLFLVSPTRMSYYLGASTRDRTLTARHGPTAVFWRAMQLARELEIPRFDLGAVTPTDDASHPHHSVYQFKRGFGGRLEELHGGEVVLSPLKCGFQNHVVLPAWKHLYPWYLWLAALRAVTP